MKKGAIFDMDGLLFDTERLYRDSWTIRAAELGLDPDPEFPKAVCGSSGELMLDIIRQYYPDIDPEVLRDACIDRVNECLKAAVPEKPGIHEMLSFMKENGVRIAVASSSPMETIQSNLERTGILSFFDVITSGQEVEKGQPEPDIFLLAAQRLELEPEDCYVFEDGSNGIHAGAAAGCATVMIPDLTEPNEELKNLTAGIYDSLMEAKEAIIRGEI